MDNKPTRGSGYTPTCSLAPPGPGAERKVEKVASSSGDEGRSTSQETDSVTEEDLLDGLFVEGTRVRAISERFPGTLCQQALSVMQENLLTEVGEDPTSSKARPISPL